MLQKLNRTMSSTSQPTQRRSLLNKLITQDWPFWYCVGKMNTESYSATARVGAKRTIGAKQTRGIEASPQAVRCPSDHLVPSGSPASEVASWLWCLAGPSAERYTPQVSGSDQQTAYRTRRDDPHAMTNRRSHLNLTWFPPLLTQIWKEWQRLEIRSHPPAWRMVLQDEIWGPA